MKSTLRISRKPFDLESPIFHGHPYRHNLQPQRKYDLIIYFWSEVTAKKNCRKYRLRRLRVEFLENGLSTDHEIFILRADRGQYTSQTYRNDVTRFFRSAFIEFEKRSKMPHPTALFALSQLQCQMRLQISRAKNIANVFEMSGVAFRLAPLYVPKY